MDPIQQPGVSELTNMLWISAAFIALAERDGLSFLSKDVDLVSIQEKTNIPIHLLSGLLDILIESKFVINTGDCYRFTDKMLESNQNPKNISLLRTNYGQVFNMITSAREDKMGMGWNHTQEYLLQAQGDTSEKIVTQIFDRFDIVKSAIEKFNATLLDVGAGVCGISIKACEQYPNLNVVGLEPSEEPYNIGQQNILSKGFEKRIHLRKLLLENLQDVNKYDVIWFPQAFIPDEVFSKCLLQIKKALKPNGVLVTHIMSTSKPGIGPSIGRLKNILFGGSLRSCEKLLEDLEKTGFYDLQTYEDNSGIAIAGIIRK